MSWRLKKKKRKARTEALFAFHTIGANQSVALGRAGANVYHAGKIGKDGEWVRKIMEDAGVDTSYIKVAPKEVLCSDRVQSCLLI